MAHFILDRWELAIIKYSPLGLDFSLSLPILFMKGISKRIKGMDMERESGLIKMMSTVGNGLMESNTGMALSKMKIISKAIISKDREQAMEN